MARSGALSGVCSGLVCRSPLIFERPDLGRASAELAQSWTGGGLRSARDAFGRRAAGNEGRGSTNTRMEVIASLSLSTSALGVRRWPNLKSSFAAAARCPWRALLLRNWFSSWHLTKKSWAKIAGPRTCAGTGPAPCASVTHAPRRVATARVHNTLDAVGAAWYYVVRPKS